MYRRTGGQAGGGAPTVPRSLADASDAELAAAIADQDLGAFEEVYRRNADRIFGLACHLLHDRARAEEVVQEVFLRLWRAPERFDADRGPLRSFLSVDVHGRALDALRADGRRARREDAGERLMVDTVPPVDIAAIDRVHGEAIRAAVDALSEGERQAITMAYFSGLTYREVASTLDLPEGTVKSRIRAGLMHLRRAVDDVREPATG